MTGVQRENKQENYCQERGIGIKDKEEGTLAKRGKLEQGALGVESEFGITGPS